MAERINKARYWWAVLWEENLKPDWKETIADTLQLPFAYCVHDRSRDSKSEHRKTHVHLIIAFPNTTTYKHALDIFELLGSDAVNTCQACNNLRHCYDYLIHQTESCKTAGKEEYDPSERVTGNGFDIGLYEQVSFAEKKQMKDELIEFIKDRSFTNIVDADDAVVALFDGQYKDVFRENTPMFERYCKANYLKWQKKQKAKQLAAEAKELSEK